MKINKSQILDNPNTFGKGKRFRNCEEYSNFKYCFEKGLDYLEESIFHVLDYSDLRKKLSKLIKEANEIKIED